MTARRGHGPPCTTRRPSGARPVDHPSRRDPLSLPDAERPGHGSTHAFSTRLAALDQGRSSAFYRHPVEDPVEDPPEKQKAPLREVGPDLRLRWWRGWDLNPRPSGYESPAQPVPLRTGSCPLAGISPIIVPPTCHRVKPRTEPHSRRNSRNRGRSVQQRGTRRAPGPADVGSLLRGFVEAWLGTDHGPSGWPWSCSVRPTRDRT